MGRHAARVIEAVHAAQGSFVGRVHDGSKAGHAQPFIVLADNFAVKGAVGADFGQAGVRDIDFDIFDRRVAQIVERGCDRGLDDFAGRAPIGAEHDNIELGRFAESGVNRLGRGRQGRARVEGERGSRE